MMAEFFRMASHLVWYGTMSQDVGMLSPVFYTFADRERIFHISRPSGRQDASQCGSASAASPRICREGWDKMVRDYLPYMRRRLKEY